MDEKRLQTLQEAVARSWALGYLNVMDQNPDMKTVMLPGFGEVTRADLEELAKGPDA